MAAKPTGICHLCGTDGPLSFEHIPPRSAFNEFPAVAKALDALIKGVDPKTVKGKIFQRGSGAYTLCSKCNNNTGAWYGNDFVMWVKQGMEILSATKRSPSLYYNFHLFPLRVLKQVACMFFSVNSNKWREKHTSLEHFVLNRKERHLPDKFKIYAFYAVGPSARQSNVSSWVNLADSSKNSTFTEVAFPPFGYVLAYDNPPHPQMQDITYFSRYDYDDYKRLTLKLPVLPVVSYFPGDYRTEEEIEDVLELYRAEPEKKV